MIELQFYPEYIGDNEYIELFYKALEPYGVRARDGLVVSRHILREQEPRPDIVQIQWCPERIWRGEDRPHPRHLRNVARLWRYLRLARRLGVRVVWTVHDFVHHDHRRSSFVDLCGYRVLARGADLCICHTEKVRGDVIRHYWARPGRTVVMPHGNYDGVYPPPSPRSQTLSRLGLSESVRTLVCFGMIRPYKGIEVALEATRLLGEGYQIVVAGCPYEVAYVDELRERSRGMSNVRLIPERVDKQRLTDLIHAADCVLLPYMQVTGSGAFLTAVTLGRGVVASDLPFFREILAREPEAGVLCKPGDARDTARAIDAFFGTPVETRHSAARRIADQYDWSSTIRPVADWIIRTFPGKVRDVTLAGRETPTPV